MAGRGDFSSLGDTPHVDLGIDRSRCSLAAFALPNIGRCRSWRRRQAFRLAIIVGVCSHFGLRIPSVVGGNIPAASIGILALWVDPIVVPCPRFIFVSSMEDDRHNARGTTSLFSGTRLCGTRHLVAIIETKSLVPDGHHGNYRTIRCHNGLAIVPAGGVAIGQCCLGGHCIRGREMGDGNGGTTIDVDGLWWRFQLVCRTILAAGRHATNGRTTRKTRITKSVERCRCRCRC